MDPIFVWYFDGALEFDEYFVSLTVPITDLDVICFQARPVLGSSCR